VTGSNRIVKEKRAPLQEPDFKDVAHNSLSAIDPKSLAIQRPILRQHTNG